MEPFYYNHMDKERQAVYRAMQQGLLSLADSFQIPRIDGHALSDIFFELRLDHPEIFWVSSFKYRYFADSPNLIFIPEYLFEKSKIKDHQKAMNARVEKLARPAAKLPELEKEKYIHDFICENIHYDKLKSPIPMKLSDRWVMVSASARGSQSRSRSSATRLESGV